MSHMEDLLRSDRAELDALRAMIADLPDAHAYARWLETARPEEALALLNAKPGHSAAERGFWVVSENMARPCAMLGLVGVRTRIIGTFGMQVRAAMMDEADD